MKLVLKTIARRARVRQGHPWVFINELETPPVADMDGMAVPMEDANGHHLGIGIVNTQSQITWRKFTGGQDGWNADFWRRALIDAIQ